MSLAALLILPQGGEILCELLGGTRVLLFKIPKTFSGLLVHEEHAVFCVRKLHTLMFGLFEFFLDFSWDISSGMRSKLSPLTRATFSQIGPKSNGPAESCADISISTPANHAS